MKLVVIKYYYVLRQVVDILNKLKEKKCLDVQFFKVLLCVIFKLGKLHNLQFPLFTSNS